VGRIAKAASEASENRRLCGARLPDQPNQRPPWAGVHRDRKPSWVPPRMTAKARDSTRQPVYRSTFSAGGPMCANLERT